MCYTNSVSLEPMCPVSQTEGHDAPGLVYELIPGVAADIDDVVVGAKIRFDSQVLRMNCQTFSTGFNSGERGGSGRM
ncbi:hypothetical protein EDC31_13125, partial [Acidomonas methanolica]